MVRINSNLKNNIKNKSYSQSSQYQNVIIKDYGGFVSLIVSNYDSSIIVAIDTNVVKTSLSSSGIKSSYLCGNSDANRLAIDGAVKENNTIRIKFRTNNNSNFICSATFMSGVGTFV